MSFGAPATEDNEDDGNDLVTAFFGVSQALAANNDHVPGGPPTVGNIGRNTMSVGAFNDVAHSRPHRRHRPRHQLPGTHSRWTQEA